MPAEEQLLTHHVLEWGKLVKTERVTEEEEGMFLFFFLLLLIDLKVYLQEMSESPQPAAEGLYCKTSPLTSLTTGFNFMIV